MLEEYYNVSNSEEFKSTYCVQEDVSGQPTSLWRIIGVFNNINDGTNTLEARLKIIRDKPYVQKWHGIQAVKMIGAKQVYKKN